MPSEIFPHYHGPAWLHPSHARRGVGHHDYVIWCDGSGAFAGGRLGRFCKTRIEGARWPFLGQWWEGERRIQLVWCRSCRVHLAVEVSNIGPVGIVREYGEGEAPRESSKGGDLCVSSLN